MKQNISLKSIDDFKTKQINFYIPDYQRGYRWKSRQVEQLIDDINAFNPTESNPFYFLQALAVANDTENNRVNVVDGQQRLTTLNLILGGGNNGINITYAREINNALDKYFKSEAEETINERVGEIGNEKRTQFCEKVTNYCKFLYYEVDKEKEQSTFNELNSGKIPAKDSELIKCIMLTIDSDESHSITASRAKEWDDIERMLNNDSFFSFITPKNWREGDRMTILFRYAGISPTEAERQKEVFPFLATVLKELKTKSRSTLWKMIYSAYYCLIEWYNDPLMYHAFGAFVHRRGNKEILSIKEKNDILSSISEMANYTPNADKNDYENWGDNLFNYLLLSNVAYCWKHWPNRYNFEKHRQVDSWSMEHIFARNQRDLDEDELKEWLETKFSDEKWKEYQEECKKENGEGNKWLANELGDSYPSSEDHSIGNLALLPRNANSSLNNKLFEGKRNQICEWTNKSQEYWIPPFTEAVFMKSLPGLKIALPYWSEEDKKEYSENLIKKNIETFIEELKNPKKL